MDRIELSNLPSLELADVGARDLSLYHLPRLKKLRASCVSRFSIKGSVALRQVDFLFCHLSADGIAQLNGIRTLAGLGSGDGHGVWWSDELQAADALAWIYHQTELEKLNLRNAELHGVDLSELQCLANLDELNLAYTDVDDSSLMQLKGLRSLRTLNVTGTNVTVDGIADIQKAMPGLQIKTSE